MINRDAQAFWLREPGKGEIRDATLSAPASGQVQVRTLFSGISRGTESLVFHGRVPESQRAVMRAPFQQGEFPGPVKYGYLNVGIVEEGPGDLQGRVVFCLFPHQTRYVVPAASVVPVPDGVPARRAVLAGMLETAVNAMWDAAPLVGDRIAVIGAGVLGCCVARLAASIAGACVTLVDVNPDRERVARALDVDFAQPGDAPHECDVVFHTSASAAGLQLAVDMLQLEGRVMELSWYGDATVDVRLGGAFHSRRLAIRASQVGQIATVRRGRRSNHDRLALALDLLSDRAFDALLSGTSRFRDLPRILPELADGRIQALCHVIAYS